MQAGKRKKGVRRLVFGLASLSLIAGMTIAFWPRPRLLLEKSTRIMALDPNAFPGFAWVSDHAVLTCSVNRDTDKIGLVRHEVPTGADTEEPGLLHAIQQDELFSPVDINGFSPDGKYLLWQNTMANTLWQNSLGDTVFAVSRQGKMQRWKVGDGNTYLSWLPDSRHWIAFFMTQKPTGHLVAAHLRTARLYCLDNPQLVRTFALGSQKTLLDAPNSILLPNSPLSETQVRIALFPMGQTFARCDLVTLDLTQQAKEVRRTTVTLPPDSQLPSLAFSPDHQRIAWALQQQKIEPLSMLLHRLLRSSPIRSDREAGIWVSGLAGEAREVGHIVLPKGQEDAKVGNLSWLPGGKRLSFTYKDALYTVPVEPAP